MALFDEPVEPRTSPLGRIEPAVHWFSESTRPEAVASRDVINRWYEAFPDPDGKFAARLISEVDVDHYQALDELYVHHVLRQRCDDVRYEEGGVGPDFRVYGGGQCVAGVEVLSIFQREDWTAEEKRHARLADEVNRRLAPTAGYFVDFDIEQAAQEPPPRRVADFIQRELDKLPPHDQLEWPEQTTGADLPSAQYDRNGVRIAIRFMPMAKDAPSKSDPDARIVGSGPVIGGMVNSAERLKDRVEAKAGGRYDIVDVPFLVVVGVHDTFCGDDDVEQALYGGESVLIPSGEPIRRNDGLFGIDKARPAGRHRRISAVAVINGLRVWEPEAAEVGIFNNPYAARAWPDETFPASRRFGVVEVTDGRMRLDWK